MILADTAIRRAVDAGAIVITPFDDRALGGNSYDVHLSPHLLTYKAMRGAVWNEPLPLDCKIDNPTIEHTIDDHGYVLKPGQLYLASTIEYTETHEHVPYLDGKSSVGRLGINIHATAGRGDVGFCGHWTMEITVVLPVRVYAGMPIGQLTFHQVKGVVRAKYATKANAKYVDAHDPKPQASRMYRNFSEAKP